jgi:hypothetical protein
MSNQEAYKVDATNLLIGMGYAKSKSEVAMERCGYDIQYAIEFLSRADEEGIETEDGLASFDFEENRQEDAKEGDLEVERYGSAGSGGRSPRAAASVEDTRLAQLKEMGFTEKEAEEALHRAGNDFNEALSILLSESEI